MENEEYENEEYETEEQELAEEDSELHAKLLKEFDDIQSSYADEREQCLEDRRFYSIAGAQWEGDLEDQFENKPKLEINKVHLSIIRIFSEYRNNRIAVDFVSADNNDKLADVCDGLLRADENDSNAQEAYDNAFEEAVGGGIGAWRLKAVLADDEDIDNDEQRIAIEPIYDADSTVFFDINSKRQDKADAKSCYVLTGMTKEAFEEEFDEDVASLNKQITDSEFDWSQDDVVYVAEVYKVEKVDQYINVYRLATGSEERYTQDELEEEPEIESNLLARGFVLKEVKKRKVQKVHKYIISGSKILEDCGYIAGKHIPIIPVYGKRWYVDGVERCMGHVRLAKDAQRLKNMQLSKLAEISAASGYEKPIVAPEQIKGWEDVWKDDNIKNFAFLPLNSMKDANGNPMQAAPLGYTRPPSVPPAMGALLQLTEADITDVLGNQQNGEKIMSNISGEAIEKIQDRLDMQTFIYVSNLAKALKRSGEVWLSMARELYVEDGRIMKVISKEKKSSKVKLNTPTINQETREEEYENDLSKANFDVIAEVGASTSTKRKATVMALKEMMMSISNPEDMQILGSLALMNMEGEGISDARQYFRNRLVRQGVIEPNEEEADKMAQEAQNREPSAQDKYLIAEAEKSSAQAQKAIADTAYAKARADETTAKTAEILAKLERDDREQILSILQMAQGGQQQQ